MKNTNNITLIGLPGAGKTTLGRLLSTQLGMGFVDTDRLISLAIEDTLQNFINIHGSHKFKQIEEEIVSTLSINNSIISTGGSVVYSDRAMLNLRDISTVIYLDVPMSTIIERISLNPNRGIVKKENQTVDQVLTERLPLYEKWCDLKIENMSKSPYYEAIHIKKKIIEIIES